MGALSTATGHTRQFCPSSSLIPIETLSLLNRNSNKNDKL